MGDEGINAVLAQFKNVKATAYGWQACCPAHDDHRPSLSIKVDDGKILLHCHANCSKKEVLAAAGLRWGDLFLNKVAPRDPVAQYDYADETGKLLFQTLRYKPKHFRVRRPDGEGGWIYNLDNVRRVLYQLPRLVKSNSCLIVEGEKDAETARDMRLLATCNAFGAGKWIAEYNEHFRGKHAYIIPDNDIQGESHARSVACSLVPIAKRVKIVRLPIGKDLSEWHGLGGTREQLVTLMKRAPALRAEQVAAWQTSKSPSGEFQLTKLSDLLDEPEENISWTVEGMLPTCGISLLVAKPKTGKSTLARQLAVRVARGKKFLGRKTNQGPVAYLALEEKRDEVRKHFTDLGVEGNEEIYLHCAAAPQDAVPALIELVKKHKPALVIIDPLLRLIRLSDANDYASVTMALEPLLSLAREHKTHIVLVHHLRKGQSADAAEAILGSTAFHGAVDSAILMQRTEHFRTIQTSQRYGRDLPECVLDFDEQRRSMTLGVLREEADVERVCAEIVKYLEKSNKGMTQEQIENDVTGRTGLKRAALRSLVKEHRILRTGSGVKGDPYYYVCGKKEQVSGEDS